MTALIARTAGTAPALSKALLQYLKESGTPGEVSARADTSNPKELWAEYDRHTQGEAASRVMRGYALAVLQYSHAESFAAGLRERDVARSSAYDLIAYYGRFLQVGSLEGVRALGHIEPRKINVLQPLNGEQFEALMSGDRVCGLTLAEVAESSTRDVETRFRTWRAEHDTELQRLRSQVMQAQSDAYTHQQEVGRLRIELQQRANTEKTPPWYGASRAETIALTEQMALCLIELEKVANENIFDAPFRSDNEKAFARMAAGTVYHTLGGITAQAQQLLKRLVERFGKEITGEREVRVCLLSGEELQRLVATRLELVRNMEADKDVRRQLRAIELPRGRGRPKGAKNKKAKAR